MEVSIRIKRRVRSLGSNSSMVFTSTSVFFDEYIEDILTRILCGEEVDASFLPCDYVRHFEDVTDAEVTKTSQAVA